MYEYLTVEEVRRRLGVDRITLDYLIYEGVIRNVRFVTIRGVECVRLTAEEVNHIENLASSLPNVLRVMEMNKLAKEIRERLDRLEFLEYQMYDRACFNEKVHEKYEQMRKWL